MVHVGEPPPLFDEVLEILTPGDVVTHCFNGKAGGSIIEDDDLFALAERCAGEGIRLDVGHGGASFSFKVAEVAIARGLMPFSISTDLHNRSLDSPVWDLGTTMSKLLAVGMPFEAVVEAVDACAEFGDRVADGRPSRAGQAAPSSRSSMSPSADLRDRDSMGARGAFEQAHRAALDDPRRAGDRSEPLRPNRAPCSTRQPACPHCGWIASR